MAWKVLSRPWSVLSVEMDGVYLVCVFPGVYSYDVMCHHRASLLIVPNLACANFAVYTVLSNDVCDQ